ncbi:MAG TPA: alpha/beta hydrolase [Mycobacteriales bacterium]
MKPTLVLAHGAYADSGSWNAVIAPLQAQGHRVIAAAVPLRSLAGDAQALTDLVRSIDGPVVLVGHSYAGSVVTNVDPDAGEIVALVYANGFALAPGESSADASVLAPGGTLGDTLVTVPLAGGGVDTYIDPPKYHAQFCADLPAEQAALMAVTQRPITQAALAEPSGATSLWRTVPSWFIYGELDKNIPAGAHKIMAERAGARRAVEVPGASHVVPVSHPDQTVQFILDAVDSVTPSNG